MSATHRIRIQTSESSASLQNDINSISENQNAVGRLGGFISSLGGGNKDGSIVWNLGAVQASGYITFASFAAADTITLNGVTVTGDDTPTGQVQIETGTSDENTANSALAVINANTTAKIVGCLGMKRQGTCTVSAMVADDTVTVNGIVFTCKASPSGIYEFKLGSTDTLTGANLSAVINQAVAYESVLSGVASSSTAGVLTIISPNNLELANSAHGTIASDTVLVYCLIPGQIGNLCTLAISARGSVSAAALTGGTEGTQYTYKRTAANDL